MLDRRSITSLSKTTPLIETATNAGATKRRAKVDGKARVSRSKAEKERSPGNLFPEEARPIETQENHGRHKQATSRTPRVQTKGSLGRILKREKGKERRQPSKRTEERHRSNSTRIQEATVCSRRIRISLVQNLKT